MLNIKFYDLDHGWATKYYWFDITDKVGPYTPPFEEMIKKNKFTFTKQSGTISADIHGSTMAINFYSQRFIDFFGKVGIKDFSTYKLKFVPEIKNIGAYYYVEFKDMLPAKRSRENVTFYLKDWKGQSIFTIEGTRMTIITENLCKLIEKKELKNVQFKEIVPYIK